MCGIGGMLRVWRAEERESALRTPHGRSIPEEWLDVIDESIRQRGPDGRGRFRDRVVRADGRVVDVALVHRRLSIIDHACGAQPMVLSVPRGGGAERLLGVEEVGGHSARVLEGNGREVVRGGEPEAVGGAESDLIAVVFNGCIYNHRELRADLQAAGHVFQTDHSDTEVLLHGWRAWGGAMFDRLDGMYAVVIWDGCAGELVAARDPFGEKPLYKVDGLRGVTGLWAFASTPASMIRLRDAVMGGPARDDERRAWTLPWVKFGWNQGMTPIPDVHEVTPGAREAPASGSAHVAGADAKWWCASFNPSGEPLGEDELDRLLQNAVRTRLEADVPLATYLSGGIDSALVTALAARHRPGLCAYTVRMPEGAYDESAAAAVTARALGVEHRILDCDPRPAGDLVAMIEQLGLPFGDSSLLPTLWVSRAAGREVKVALAGDGGDEMFLGYDRHRAIRWLAWLDQWPRETVEALAAALPIGSGTGPRSRRDRLARLVNAAAGQGYKELAAIFPSPLDAELGLVSRGGAGWGEMHHFGMTTGGGDRDMIETLALRFDRMFYLPCDLMRKSDTASMSVPIEVRSPMLQSDLAWAAMNAPAASLMPRGERKGLLRRVARRYLPTEVVDRPKRGFAIPVGEWFRTDYGGMRTMLLDHLNSAEPFGPAGVELDMRYVRRMLDEHLGTGMSGVARRDHSQRLYMLLVLSVWGRWMER